MQESDRPRFYDQDQENPKPTRRIKQVAAASGVAVALLGAPAAVDLGARLITNVMPSQEAQKVPTLTYSINAMPAKERLVQPIIVAEFPQGESIDPATIITRDELAKAQVDLEQLKGFPVEGPDYIVMTQTDGSVVFEPKRTIHDSWFKFKEKIIVERNGKLEEVQPVVPMYFVKRNEPAPPQGAFVSTPPGMPPLSGLA